MNFRMPIPASYFAVAALAVVFLGFAPSAHASFLPPELMDKAAMYLAWFIICAVPIGGIVLFWLVHVLPEKIAHKRHHPQRDAIHTLCLLSLAFGGLLWPIAWLWAYTKPVGYRMAYGTEKHEDYYRETIEKAHAGELLEHELAHLRDELDEMAAKGTLTGELKVLRRDLAAAVPAPAGPVATHPAPGAKARLVADEAKFAQAGAGVVESSAGARELQEQLKSASGQVSTLLPRLELARLRVRQNRELVATGAGDRFALEQAEANVIELEGQIATARANEAQVVQKLSGQVNGEQASVAASRAQLATAKAQVDVTRADLANAQWNLDQTATYAPTSGYAINVQLRPGSYVTAFPVAPAMSFVEETYQVIALYAQNELQLVEPGNAAEFTLKTYPGHIIKAKVDSIA